MLSCRAKIGFISPAGDTGGSAEFTNLLPNGVEMIARTLAVSKLVHEDAEKAFTMYPAAVEHMAAQDCDLIRVGGSLVFSHIGWDKATEMFNKMRKAYKTPIITDLDAHFDALRAFKAKKIVIVTPYVEARTMERKKLCESMGFQVVNTKSLGIEQRTLIQELSPWVVYRMAKQAVMETPEADAIYISCPEWETGTVVAELEQDTGKPVVYPAGAEIWSWMKILSIKDKIEGYGQVFDLP